MSMRDQPSEKWINPLLEKLDLVQPRRIFVDLRLLWTELEEFRVLERIRTIVADINRQAGRRVLEALDYLPPQRTVLRVVYTKDKVEYVMAIVLRGGGTAVSFHSTKVVASAWNRYLPGWSKSRQHPVEIARSFRAPDITDEIIRNWFSFLLSCFSRKFEAGLVLQPLARRESDPKAASRRAS